MKQVLFLLIAFITTQQIFAQTDSSDVMEMKMPNKVHRLNSSEFGVYAQKQQMDTDRIHQYQGHVYKLDSITFFYRNEQGDANEKKILEERGYDFFEVDHKRSVGAFKRLPGASIVDTAYITTINNIRYSILKIRKNIDNPYDYGSNYRILFSSDYNKHLRRIVGRVDYDNINDKEKAEAWLNELLESMRFRQ